MIIAKVINNNIVSSYDDKSREVVVMGKGLGFGRRPGETIEESQIEKIFVMDNSKEVKRLEDVLEDIPLENIQIVDNIIDYAKEAINKEFSKSIYITLIDHINFAIDRVKKDMKFKNPLMYEIKKFYPQEFAVGQHARGIIQDNLSIQLEEDEAASIAMHFVNAEMGNEMPETMDITKIMQHAFKIIKYSFQLEIDENDANYDRFVTYMKFFAQRIITDSINANEDEEFYSVIRTQYPKEYECAGKIKKYIEVEYNIIVSEEEMINLTLHIRRITRNIVIK